MRYPTVLEHLIHIGTFLRLEVHHVGDEVLAGLIHLFPVVVHLVGGDLRHHLLGVVIGEGLSQLDHLKETNAHGVDVDGFCVVHPIVGHSCVVVMRMARVAATAGKGDHQKGEQLWSHVACFVVDKYLVFTTETYLKDLEF